MVLVPSSKASRRDEGCFEKWLMRLAGNDRRSPYQGVNAVIRTQYRITVLLYIPLASE